MPTRAEFEAAADKFEAAAAQVGDLAANADGVGASAILRGGSLGRQVPARIAESAQTARACQGRLDVAVQTCIERAAAIAEYEIRLAAYEGGEKLFRSASLGYRSRLDRWFLDTTGTVSHPGAPPTPPTKPTPPPDWADVRRP